MQRELAKTLAKRWLNRRLDGCRRPVWKHASDAVKLLDEVPWVIPEYVEVHVASLIWLHDILRWGVHETGRTLTDTDLLEAGVSLDIVGAVQIFLTRPADMEEHSYYTRFALHSRLHRGALLQNQERAVQGLSATKTYSWDEGESKVYILGREPDFFWVRLLTWIAAIEEACHHGTREYLHHLLMTVGVFQESFLSQPEDPLDMWFYERLDTFMEMDTSQLPDDGLRC